MRILVTGMSGTGKSTLILELAARGYQAVDTDSPEWSVWKDGSDGSGSPQGAAEPDWVWREDRIQRLLDDVGTGPLFVSGCKSNQGKFYPQFDYVVVLTAPLEVLMDRIATRTTNNYGKSADELDRILGHVRAVEPRLRGSADVVLDTQAPVTSLVEALIALAGPTP